MKADSGKQSALWLNTLVVILTCWVVSLIILGISIVGLGYTTQLPHIFPVSVLDSPEVYDSHLSVESDRERLRLELEPIVVKLGTREEKVLAILAWVMNQIPIIESRTAQGQGSWELIEIGRAGGGLTCGGMAQLFHDALLSQQIPARRVLLQRNVFDVFDTHVTVEAFVDGKWRLYDPTFHIALNVDGEHIGSAEARNLFYLQKGNIVDVEFLGDVRYPARIASYPIRYEALFNNVYVELRRSHGIVRAIPFVGLWLGPLWAYQEHWSGLSTMAQDFYRVLYYTALVVLPSISLALLFVIGFLWRKLGRFRQ